MTPLERGRVQKENWHTVISATVKALPGSSLEVVKTEPFFHLLVSLLANPSWLGPPRCAVAVG